MVLTAAQVKDQGTVGQEKDLGKVMAVNTKILIDNNLSWYETMGFHILINYL